MAASVPNKFVGTTTQDVSSLDANFDALVNYLNSLGSAYAALNGSSTQIFSVDTGVAATDAVNVDQSFVQADAITSTNVVSTKLGGTAYTNTSNKAEFHFISLSGSTSFTTDFEFYIGGVWYSVATAAYDATQGTAATIAIVVPPGMVWQVTALPTYWSTIK